jgi:hypothetical protein
MHNLIWITDHQGNSNVFLNIFESFNNKKMNQTNQWKCGSVAIIGLHGKITFIVFCSKGLFYESFVRFYLSISGWWLVSELFSIDWFSASAISHWMLVCQTGNSRKLPTCLKYNCLLMFIYNLAFLYVFIQFSYALKHEKFQFK